MVKRLIAVVAVLGVCGCASAPARQQWEMPKEEWAFVCEATRALGYDKVDCSRTPPPIIVESEVVGDTQGDWEVLYGFTYPGEVYIFINPAYPEKASEVRVHEATHYLLTQTYGLDGMPTAVGFCESEDVARQVGSKWSGEPVDPMWRIGYRCSISASSSR